MHTEITTLTNKENSKTYEVTTRGRFTILVILIHKITVWKLKRWLKFSQKFNKTKL